MNAAWKLRRQFTGYKTNAIHLRDGTVHKHLTYSMEGIKPAGERVNLFATSAEAAWGSFDRALDGYLRGRPGHIHWRHRPEILEGEILEHNLAMLGYTYERLKAYYIWSRLVVGEFTPDQLEDRELATEIMEVPNA